MLVLTRRKHESISIGPNVVITVVDIRSKSVRLGIEAPPEVPVHREEIGRRIDQAIHAAKTRVGSPVPGGPQSGPPLPPIDPPGDAGPDG